MVDIDCLQAAWPEILEPVWDARRSQYDFSSGSIQYRVADEKTRLTCNYDECLVIRVHMETRTNANLFCAVRQHSNWPTECKSFQNPSPGAAVRRIEEPRL